MTVQGYLAFLPASLPPQLTYGADLVLALSRADTALSELAGVGRLVPNPHLLITPYMRREAVLSSRIEGTRASLSDLLLDEAGEVPDQRDAADINEVRNYVRALEFGIARLEALPLSLRLVREVHERLVAGVRGEYATPGEFRRTQNWIGPSGSSPSTAPYVPPPPLEMREALNHWERFLHERETMPDLIQCALMHEQFEAIHRNLRETYRARLRKAPRALALLDALFLNPYITVARAAQLLHVSSPTARAAVLILQEQGILAETTGGAWRRIYLAAPILRAVEDPPPA